MLKLHTKSQLRMVPTIYIPVILGVVSTNHHTHYFSAVVSGRTNIHAKTAHQASVWFLPYFCHLVVSTNHHTHYLGAVVSGRTSFHGMI